MEGGVLLLHQPTTRLSEGTFMRKGMIRNCETLSSVQSKGFPPHNSDENIIAQRTSVSQGKARVRVQVPYSRIYGLCDASF